MSLDVFQNDETMALADASGRIAPDLPATFGDTFDAAVTNGIEWHNSIASQFAKEHALRDYIQNVRDMTGEALPNPGYLVGSSLDEFNARQQALNEKYPINLQPLTSDDIEQMTARRMAKAHNAYTAVNARERTWGGTAGNVLGSLTASTSDPVMLATLPLGGMGQLGIVGRALEFGAIGAGTEAAVDLAQYGARERAVHGSSKEIPGEILSAGLFGIVLGGAFGTLGKFLKAGEKPLPTSARDEVNVGASDAQINATNVFPTVEGEIAGRDALTAAVTQAAKGEPVTAGRGFDPAHVEAFAESVGAKDAEALALAGERSQRPITFGEMPNFERFETMPIAGEDSAGYWDRHLEAATAEERAALGATDLPERPNTAPAETPTGESPRPGNDVSGRINASDLSPAAVTKLAGRSAARARPQHHEVIAMSELPTVPTRQAAAIEGRSGRLTVTGKLKTALEAMVWEGLSRPEAATLAGLADNSVRVALRKVHVMRFYNAELAALRNSLRARGTHNLAQIMDKSDNDAARVKAVQVLEGMSDVMVSGGPGGGRARAGYLIDLSEAQSPGVVIQIISPPPKQEPAMIDVTPPQIIPRTPG